MNGELEQQFKGVPGSNFSSDGKNYTVDTEGNLWSIECEAGDNINIRFHCKDKYGLGYDFLFANWIALNETDENTQSAVASYGTSKSLDLFWPE